MSRITLQSSPPFLALALMLVTWATPVDAQTECNSLRVVNPLPVALDLLGVAVGDNATVAVGANGTILRSRDFISWDEMPAPVTTDLEGLVWFGGEFIAVGDDGVILTSVDGESWQLHSNPSTAHLLAVAGGAPGLVAVGEGGTILLRNGDSGWLEQSTPTQNHLNSVTWTGEIYIAVGDHGAILTSSDGNSWDLRDSNYDRELVAVASNGSTSVAIGRSSMLFVSSDGVEWTDKRLGGSSSMYDVTWCDQRWVIAGGSGTHLTSPDGEVWSPDLSPRDRATLAAIACTDGSMIGVGLGGQIATGDGLHWAVVNSVFPGNLRGVASNGERVVATYGPGYLTGTIWNPDTVVPASGYLSQVAWGQEKFVAVGLRSSSGGHYPYPFAQWSTDGSAWASADLGDLADDELLDVVFDGERFATSTYFGWVSTSEDGESWTSVDANVVGPGDDLASNGSILVSVSPNEIFRLDFQDPRWTLVDERIDRILRSVAWGDAGFVAVGQEGFVQTSPDGSGWEDGSVGLSVDLWRVEWTGSRYLAMGEDGIVMESQDGRNWTALTSGTSSRILAAAGTSAGEILVGQHGLILRSDCSDQDDAPTAAIGWRPSLPVEGRPLRFFDQSGGRPDSWTWSFADGTESTEQNPTRVFAEPGTYEVTLEVSSTAGASQTTALVTVVASCGPPTQVPVVEAPAEAPSGEQYQVSWPAVEASNYRIETSPDPSFPRASTASRQVDGLLYSFSHHWADGRVRYHRVAAINECSDGPYVSTWSATTQTSMKPVMTSAGLERVIIPAAAHGVGMKSTTWSTDVMLHNPSESPATVVMYLLDGRGAAGASLELLLEPSHTQLVEDVVARLAEENLSAGIVVDSDRPVLVSSRTANRTADGSYGQFIPAVNLEDAIVDHQPRSIIEVTRNGQFRTNLGFANPSPAVVMVRVTVYEENGDELWSEITFIRPWDSAVITDVSAETAAKEVNGGWAEVTVLTSRAEIFAWGSVVDNDSGDPAGEVVTSLPPPMIRHDRDALPKFEDSNSSWREVTYGRGTYVAVGASSIGSSDDGIHWEAQDLGLDGRFVGVQWNGEQFLAVGCGFVALSDDGWQWTTTQLPADLACLNDAAWDGRRWLAITDDNTAAVSLDGRHWEGVSAIDGINRAIEVLWTGEIYVVVGSGGAAVSSDGTEWRHGLAQDDLVEVSWNGEVLVAAGSSQLLTSADGVEWVSRLGYGQFDNVEWNGQVFIVRQRNSADRGYYTSSDGVSWSYTGLRTTSAVMSLARDGAAFIGLSAHGDVSWFLADDESWLVPAVAHAPGVNGSLWRSDLVLINESPGPVLASVEYLPGAGDDSGPAVTLTVPANGSVRVEDVLGELVGAEGVGALRVQPSEQLRVTSRTWTASEAGSLGQRVPAVSYTAAVWPFEEGRLVFLSESLDPETGWRSNLGLVSGCGEQMQVSVRVLHVDGHQVGERVFQLQPYEHLQKNRFLHSLGDDEITGATVVLSTTTHGCRFFAYASVIDNRTNDPYLVSMMKSK